MCAYLRQVTTWWMRQHPKVLGLKFRPDVKRQAPTPRPHPTIRYTTPFYPALGLKFRQDVKRQARARALLLLLFLETVSLKLIARCGI